MALCRKINTRTWKFETERAILTRRKSEKFTLQVEDLFALPVFIRVRKRNKYWASFFIRSKRSKYSVLFLYSGFASYFEASAFL